MNYESETRNATEKKAFKQLGTGRTKGVEQSERGKGLTTWNLTGSEGAGQIRPNKYMEQAAGKKCFAPLITLYFSYYGEFQSNMTLAYQ